jgi:anti-sigma B factor antagonist
VFSRLTGKSKPNASEDLALTRVFESLHLTADRAGPVLLITCLEECVSEREAGILHDETEAQIDDRCTAIVVDLGKVMMLTSAGIGSLVRLHKRISERKGKLAVCSLSTELAELFKMTRMDKLLVVAPDREAALAAVRK